MPTVTLTNISSSKIHVPTLQKSVAASGTVEFYLADPDLERAEDLHALLYAGTITLTYVYQADELAFNLPKRDEVSAEMYLNGNGTATTIETASTPIALRLFTTGALSGWTFDAGSTGAISAYADYGATVTGTVKATCTAAHNLTTGDIISIRGTTNYNGIFAITVVDADEFYFTDTWVADDGASDWDQGSSLIAGASAAGSYRLTWSVSSDAAVATDVITYVPYKGVTAQPKGTAVRPVGDTVMAVSGACDITIAAGDVVFMTASNDSTGTVTNQWGNVHLERKTR